jgi:hypothetical protein
MIAMNIRGLSPASFVTAFGSFRRSGPRKPDRRRVVPGCERLEGLALLSTVNPVISGYVFNDKNNNGHFDKGELPIAGTVVALKNSAGVIIGATLTGADGSYSFSTDASVSTAPRTVTQTLTVPAQFTNLQNVPFGAGLNLFDPSLGTLVDVRMASGVAVNSTLKAENTSLTQPADISGSVSGVYQIDGLSHVVTGSGSAATAVFHAPTYDGTTDFGGASGVTFPVLSVSDVQSSTLTSPTDLAFFTAAPGASTISPTVSISATTHIGGSGNTVYDGTTKGAALLSVTYDYIPNNALKAGGYTVVALHSANFTDGKASQNGVVVNSTGGTSQLVVNLTSAGSAQNDFGESGSNPGTVKIQKHKPAPHAPIHKPIPVHHHVVVQHAAIKHHG